MKIIYFQNKKFIILVALVLIYSVDFGQTNNNKQQSAPPTKQSSAPTHYDTTKPKDNSQDGKKNSSHFSATIDSTPRPKQDFINNVLRTQNVYPNDDAYKLIELLNPELSSMDIVNTNYPVVLPVFPEPSEQAQKSLKTAYKDALKTDKNLNASYSISVKTFDTLANVFHVLNFNNASTSAGNLQDYIKEILPSVAELSNIATGRIERTSKSTVGLLNSETQALNMKLKTAINTQDLSRQDAGVIYLLIKDMNLLLYILTNHQLNIENFKVFNNSSMKLSNAAYIETDKLISTATKSWTDNSDPQKFNIYIFREDIVANTQKREPEMLEYTIQYSPPAFVKDSAAWSTIPEPASTANCFLPPATFIFSISDNLNQNVVYKKVDVYNASKDDIKDWNLGDLFRKTYKLVFLIN